MKKPNQNLMATTPHVVCADTKTPKSLIEYFKPKLSIALLEISYPLLLVGSCGSGRVSTICSLLSQNIRDEMPFVYINGQGDTSIYSTLFSYAESNSRKDDLYLINFMRGEPGLSHTFDPINPLIGDEESFLAIFGPDFGKVIHALSACELAAGKLVDIDRLRSFITLESLEQTLEQAKYASAKQIVSGYLESIRGLEHGAPGKRELEKALCLHDKNTAKANQLIELIEKYPVFSTNPDINFSQLYEHKKFLLVALPALEKDPDVLGTLNTLFACLLSRVTQHFPAASAHPAVVFDASFDQAVLRPTVLSRFAKTNTLFAYTSFPFYGRPNYATFLEIVQMARAFINMKCESPIPNSILESAWKHGLPFKLPEKIFYTLRPGDGIAWGNIGVLRNKVMRKLVGESNFTLRHVVPARVEVISLSKKPIYAD